MGPRVGHNMLEFAVFAWSYLLVLLGSFTGAVTNKVVVAIVAAI